LGDSVERHSCSCLSLLEFETIWPRAGSCQRRVRPVAKVGDQRRWR